MIPDMSLVPKREYVVLLIGDVIIFAVSLWATLALRYLEAPSSELFTTHLLPFSFLFAARVAATILYTQMVNIGLAALFFFSIPAFGLAPKTILLLYLVVSFVLIFFWRIGLYPHVRSRRRLKGVLIASGPDAKALALEVASDARYPFAFEYIIDTAHAPLHQVIQQACRVAEEDNVTFLVVDLSDKAVSAALPIIYDAAFHKRRFALLDAAALYEEVFEREPLSLVQYEWILAN